jgi:hypothetical protein
MSLIATQLRESASFLKDEGWHETAHLVIAAADEIDLLRSMLEKAGIPIVLPTQANENEDNSTQGSQHGRQASG